MKPMTTIHRHTGGLEIVEHLEELTDYIHRHTGGLENHVPSRYPSITIHRHTGGLETKSESPRAE